jgi:uncharacterized protein (DUF1800 family)
VTGEASKPSAVVATRRFGLGPAPGEVRTASADPIGFLMAQLDRPEATAIADSQPTSRELLMEYGAYLARLKHKAMPVAERTSGSERAGAPSRSPIQIYLSELESRAKHAISTEAPFLERLTMFWSDHFCVSAKPGTRTQVLAGSYEREAIRPHVLGRFEDLLMACALHPAMLNYLDNSRSVGPNSPAGQRLRRGINENLAREILELHTLGVAGGYDQSDVVAFANALSGWGFDARASESPTAVYFRENVHEPGAVTVVGREHPDSGPDQARAILSDLSSHPSTAKHIARKLAVHFVSAEPPPDLVQKLETVFLETDGDLTALAVALVASEAAWREPPRKILPPYDFVVAAHRLLGRTTSALPLVTATSRLGQRVWGPQSPAGFPQEDDHWAGPDALLERLDWASHFAAAAAGVTDVDILADETFGSALSPETRQAIGRAEDRAQALALFLMSPEFQKR